MEHYKLIYRFSHPFITNGRVQAQENKKIGHWEKKSLVIVLDHDCIQRLDNIIEKLNNLIGNEFRVESYVKFNQNVQNNNCPDTRDKFVSKYILPEVDTDEVMTKENCCASTSIYCNESLNSCNSQDDECQEKHTCNETIYEKDNKNNVAFVSVLYRNPKKKYDSNPLQCQFKRNCLKGISCVRKHTASEIEYFKKIME